MTKKDFNTLVKISIPKPEGDYTVFFITLGQLHDAIVTHPSGNITFRIGDELLSVERSKIIEYYNSAKQQIISAKSTIPAQLKDYLIDLSSSKKSVQEEKISSRDEEIEKLWSCMLLKQKSNAILVGEHGVGKTTMFLEVVRQLKTGEAPSQIANCKVIKLNTSKLLKIRYDFSMKHVISAIIKYLMENKNNIIFYVDDLLTMKYDIYLTQLLIIILKKLNVKFVASITYENYEDYFEEDDIICKYLNPIYLDEPDVEDIYDIILSKVLKLQKSYGITISEEMINFAIFTGYHLSSSNSANPESTIDVINFAFADAKRNNSKEVCKKNILRYYFINFKLEKKAENAEKIITAYHEVGHYLVTRYSENIRSYKNAFVSILPFEDSLGLTASYEDIGKQLTFDKDYFIDEIASLLGGRVGEEMYTNKYSSGAVSDLDMASTMAEQVIMSYGLSNRESEKNKSYTVSGIYVKDFLLTDDIKNEINAEMTELIKDGYDRATQIINEHKKLHEQIVSKLLKEGILTGIELDKICEEFEENQKNEICKKEEKQK